MLYECFAHIYNVKHACLGSGECFALHLNRLHEVGIQGSVEVGVVFLNPLHHLITAVRVASGDDFRINLLECVPVFGCHIRLLPYDFEHLVVHGFYVPTLCFRFLA